MGAVNRWSDVWDLMEEGMQWCRSGTGLTFPVNLTLGVHSLTILVPGHTCKQKEQHGK